MEPCSHPEAFSQAGFDFSDATSVKTDRAGHSKTGSCHTDPAALAIPAAVPIPIAEPQRGRWVPSHNPRDSSHLMSPPPPAVVSSPRKSTTGYSMPSPKALGPSSPAPSSTIHSIGPPQPAQETYHTPILSPTGEFTPGATNGAVSRPPADAAYGRPPGSPAGSLRSPQRPFGKDSRPNWQLPNDGRSGLPPVPPFETDRISNAASPMGGPSGHKKNCAKCGRAISGQFVRALGTAFHLDCFTCGDCGDPCASKFFPVGIDAPPSEMPSQIPLCERCYFKRLDLLCYRCGDALRGSYITALDRKYHVEHFTCSLCSIVFGPEDSYYEHENDVYCHYHYSTLHAARCEGCRAAILKQFVETYRGGREQQWHPECYMIFKFWNVKLAGTSVVLESDQAAERGRPGDVSLAVRQDIANREQDIDKLVTAIWTTLCSFEELTAGYVSNMVQYAVKQSCGDALEATSLLVERVQILFDALDTLPHEPDEEQRLSKEPKTLCRKIVSYMSTLSKIRQNRGDAMSNDLLTVASSIAHYLKVLIRFGLATSLAHGRENNRRTVLNNFLAAMAVQRPAVKFPVTALTSDKCSACDATVEDACVRFRDKLWHETCLTCAGCGRDLAGALDDACCRDDNAVVCTACDANLPASQEFAAVTRLGQYMFLLNIALSRLELVLGQYDARDAAQNPSLSTPSLARPAPPLSPAELKQRSASGEDVSTFKSIVAKVDSPHQRLGKTAFQATRRPAEHVPALERTSHLLQSKASLTLDDIRRIVAAEQAREHMPNSYRHRNGVDTAAAAEWLRTPQDRLKGDAAEVSYFGKLTADDYTLVQHIAAVRLLVEYPSVHFGELAEMIGRKNSSFWSKMGKAFGASKKKSASGVFGVSLEALNERSGADSSLGVGDYTLRIPSFVEDCVTAMRQKDMSVEGVFRKNGNIRRIREFVEAVDKNPDFTSTLADEQPIQLAALLKKFLRDMPEPLMGAKLTKLWLQVSSLEEERQIPFLQLVVCLLNKSQRDLLEVLTYFLNWAASFAHLDEDAGSKMDAQNLATVITPNIMHAKEEDGGDVHFQAIRAVAILIEQHMIVAEVPPEVERLLAQVKERRKERLSTRELTELIREVAGGDQLPRALEHRRGSNSARSSDS